jgi:hypothetical protein
LVLGSPAFKISFAQVATLDLEEDLLATRIWPESGKKWPKTDQIRARIAWNWSKLQSQPTTFINGLRKQKKRE